MERMTKIMGKFLEEEKKRYISLIETTNIFDRQAKNGGIYRGKVRPFCLPREKSDHNIFEMIREKVKEYFKRYDIKWHDAINGNPSNHLCDSQICCINFLFPFTDKPEAIKELLKPLYPNIKKMLPMEDDYYVAFEWIGMHDYLEEMKMRNNKKRNRGANCTSADAAVRFELDDGSIQIVLIEWKYTESYYSTPLKTAKSGRARTKIYEPFYLKDDCPLNKTMIADFKNLFFNPFYQLMRQQFLAHEMKLNCELGANMVSVLHLAPQANKDFKRVTSPAFKPYGDSAMEVWSELTKGKGIFLSQSIEKIFLGRELKDFSSLSPWYQYISERYSWENHN